MDGKHFQLIHLAIVVLCIVPACLGIGQTQFPYSLWQPAEPYCPPEVEVSHKVHLHDTHLDATENAIMPLYKISSIMNELGHGIDIY